MTEPKEELQWRKLAPRPDVLDIQQRLIVAVCEVLDRGLSGIAEAIREAGKVPDLETKTAGKKKRGR